MALTKGAIIRIFILTMTLLSFSILFKGNITGFIVFNTEVLNYPVYDYFIIILFLLTVITLFVMQTVRKIEKDIELDLDRFEVIQPNISLRNMEQYMAYSQLQGKSESRIKEVLIKQGWDETIVNEAYERAKNHNY